MNVRRALKFLVGGAVLSVLLWGIPMEVRRHSRPSIEPIRSSGNTSPLYDVHDKPTTVFLRAVDKQNGRFFNIAATIRQSKSRYNQIKQAVMAFLQGPRTGPLQVPVPEGLVLNEFYLTPQGTGVLDLSTAQVKAGDFGFYEEVLFIRGIMESLNRNFPEVKQVKILVDGQDAPTLGGHYALGTADAAMPVTISGNPKF
jgi:spore germination protein GerM